MGEIQKQNIEVKNKTSEKQRDRFSYSLFSCIREMDGYSTVFKKRIGKGVEVKSNQKHYFKNGEKGRIPTCKGQPKHYKGNTY